MGNGGMVDSVQIWAPGQRLTDTLGAPLSGAQVRFFLAGTSTPKTMYSDKALTVPLGSIIYTRADGIPVASEGSQTAVTVYTDDQDYKVDVLDSDGNTIFSARDNVRGALDTGDFLTSSSVSTFSLPVVATAISLTLSATHKAKLVNCNPGGGNITLAVTAAATLGDSWFTYVLNSAATGQVLLTASQNISYAGGTITKLALEPGQCIGIACDGVAFRIFHDMLPGMHGRNPSVITIVDRVTAAPGAPTPGARYIVSASFGSFATHDIIEANGTDFNKYTPPTNCGWIAFVQDENLFYVFVGSAWVLGGGLPAASATQAGIQENADQSEMEARSSILRNVTPGTQHFHPAHPKAGGNMNGSGTPAFAAGDVGMGAVTDNGVGNYVVAFDTSFSDTNYWCAGYARTTDTMASTNVGVMSSGNDGAKTAGTFQIKGFTVGGGSAGANVDNTEIGMMFWGDYA